MTAPSNHLPQRAITNFALSDKYRARVHDRITGGAHTYSKGDDQFPQLSPAAIARGYHGRVTDLDGNTYVDCGMALGAVSLGHAYEPVVSAVRDQLERGAAFQRPASVELEAADAVLSVMPGMERIKFAKNGSNVTTAAVKLARAYTGRPLVAFPSNHSFYSFDDWYITSTKMRAGIPDQARALSVTYDSTDPDSLARLLAGHPGQVACVISEPEEVLPGDPAAIRTVERLAKADGAVFILDEMVSGFRSGLPGAYGHLGLDPDLATWGKGIGNGFSFCALTGKAAIMDLGGIRQTDAPRVFLLSSTHGGEAHSLAAVRAVVETYRTHDVIARHHALAARVADGFRKIVADRRLSDAIEVHHAPWRMVLVCRNRDGAVAADLRTLLIQEMIGHGALFQGVFLPCFTHTDDDIAQVIDAFDKSAAVYAHALHHGISDLLVGPAARPVFRKYVGCSVICPREPCPNETTCRT